MSQLPLPEKLRGKLDARDINAARRDYMRVMLTTKSATKLRDAHIRRIYANLRECARLSER